MTPPRPDPVPAWVRGLGWRAVAIPVLTVATVAAFVHAGSTSAATGPGPAHPADGPHAAVPAAATSHPATPTAAPPATPTAAPAGTPAPAAPTAAAPAPADHCAGNTAAQLLVVSIAAQHAWVCSGATQVNDTPVTTGMLTGGLQTHVGTWHVQAKQADRYLNGPGYSEHVDYWMPYDGDFGIHDATWQTFPFGGPQWTTDGSHGCVHLPLPTMAWFYGWAQVGATVTITA